MKRLCICLDWSDNLEFREQYHSMGFLSPQLCTESMAKILVGDGVSPFSVLESHYRPAEYATNARCVFHLYKRSLQELSSELNRIHGLNLRATEWQLLLNQNLYFLSSIIIEYKKILDDISGILGAFDLLVNDYRFLLEDPKRKRISIGNDIAFFKIIISVLARKNKNFNSYNYLELGDNLALGKVVMKKPVKAAGSMFLKLKYSTASTLHKIMRWVLYKLRPKVIFLGSCYLDNFWLKVKFFFLFRKVGYFNFSDRDRLEHCYFDEFFPNVYSGGLDPNQLIFYCFPDLLRRDLATLYHRVVVPPSLKVIVTALNFKSNLQNYLFLMKAKSRLVRTCLMNHGGGYGTWGVSVGDQLFEEIYDSYLRPGMGLTCSFRLPVERNLPAIKDTITKKDVLIVLTRSHPFLYSYDSLFPRFPFRGYPKKVLTLVKAILEAGDGGVVIRDFHKQLSIGPMDDSVKLSADCSIDAGSETLARVMDKYNLLVVTYFGTVFQQCLFWNRPFVCVWFSSWDIAKPELKLMFEKMRNVGLLYYSVEEFVSNHFDNGNGSCGWFYQSEVQSVLSELRAYYAGSRESRPHNVVTYLRNFVGQRLE